MRKPRKNLTPSQRERVAWLYGFDVPVADIARQFGIHKTGVCLIARSFGMPRRHVFSKRNHVANKLSGQLSAPTLHQAGSQSFG